MIKLGGGNKKSCDYLLVEIHEMNESVGILEKKGEGAQQDSSRERERELENLEGLRAIKEETDEHNIEARELDKPIENGQMVLLT